ncbi:phospholipase A and acyltransferase 3-like [Artemia franciscana]|uniref:phospholipase A and acyltransferase 3-like n=1 Tax=Artemia franciscana TaxID=6661 RepID=UPI0032DB10D4
MLCFGDLLEFNRGCFSHWAVYIGNGAKHENEVMDLVKPDSTGCCLSGGSNFMGSLNSNENPVQARDLFDVWKDSRCRINNSYDKDSKPLTWSEIYKIYDRVLHSRPPFKGSNLNPSVSCGKSYYKICPPILLYSIFLKKTKKILKNLERFTFPAK